jgi:hypothetical protein
MTRLQLAHALALFSLLLVAARDISPGSLNAKRLEAVERWKSVSRGRSTGSAVNTRRNTDSPTIPSVKNITFTNPEASSVYATVCVSPLLSDALFRVLCRWHIHSSRQL